LLLTHCRKERRISCQLKNKQKRSQRKKPLKLRSNLIRLPLGVGGFKKEPMKNLMIVALLVVSACKTSSVPPPVVAPEPTATVAPPPSAGTFVLYGSKGTIEHSVADPALALMNKCYSSGKLRILWLTHKFVSFNCVFDKCPKTNEEAYNAYVKNAPYTLDVEWYTASRFSNVVGYTYNFKDDDWDAGITETRIWSNTRIVGGYGPKDVASHWAHELSHQTRAGGFVHYTIFDGSTPYEVGDIMSECLK
jgi:hypothetical protein